MRWIRLTCICLVGCLSGCGGIGFAYKKRLVGNLGLAAVDVMPQMAVVEFDPSGSATHLVGPTVFAVGWDQSHILAKRHPSEAVDRIDRTVTQYYIVTVPDRKAHGPFDEAEYRSQRRALGVSDSLDFTLAFKDIE
jgi:hypothetical protein